MRKATTLLENSSVMAQHNHLGIIQTKLSVNVIIYCFFVECEKKSVNTSNCSLGSIKKYLTSVMYEFSDSKIIPTLYSWQMTAKIHTVHRRKHWIVFIIEKRTFNIICTLISSKATVLLQYAMAY